MEWNKSSKIQYAYNGKEKLEKYGYNNYDYGFRHYDLALGRFQTMDPLAEKYYSVSPYAYCNNNPINAYDPDGRAANFIVGAIIGGGVDLAAQISVNLAKGQTFTDAISGVDATSVVASMALGAVGVAPWGSISKGIVTAGVTAVDAVVDYTASEGVKTLGNNKSTTDAIFDAAMPSVTGKLLPSLDVAKHLGEAVTQDLSASYAKTFSKEMTNTYRSLRDITNKGVVKQSSEIMANTISSIISSIPKEIYNEKKNAEQTKTENSQIKNLFTLPGEPSSKINFDTWIWQMSTYPHQLKRSK